MATWTVNARVHHSWSDMAVLWPFNDSTGAVTNRICGLNEILPVPVTKKLRPKFGRARHFRPENQYGDDTRFAILGLRGRLLPAFIRRNFPRQSDASVAARLTGHNTQREDRGIWRIMTQTPDHLEAAG